MNSGSTNAVQGMGIYVGGVDGASITGNQIANLGSGGSPLAISVGAGVVNTSVSNNVIGPIYAGDGVPKGIWVGSGMTNANITISGNEVSGLSTSYGGALTAMYVYGATSGVVIEKNKLYDISNNNSFGFGTRAIIINTNIPSSNIIIRNNAVWNVRTVGKIFPNSWGVGIGIDGSTGGVKVYHNSVNMYGTLASDTAGINTAFGVLSASATALDVRDNIFVNKIDNTSFC